MTGVIERFGLLGVFLLMVPRERLHPRPQRGHAAVLGIRGRQGWMSFPLAVLAATAGNLVGSLLAYGLGASRLLRRLPLARGVLSRWEGPLLEQHGTRTVFIARLLPLARTFVSLPAGARHVRLIPFIMLTTIGSALWAAAFVLTGMVAGTAWASVSSTLGRALLMVGLVAIALSLMRRWRGS
jgi:membrane protein DedA with SNARE-associated domain